MANQKISELNSFDSRSISDLDAFTFVDTSAQETKKVEWGTLKIPPFIGATVKMDANTTGLNLGASTEMVWDTERVDNGGWWAGGAPERFTVPDSYGGMLIDVTGYCDLSNVGSGWLATRVTHFNAADVQQAMTLGMDREGTTISTVRRQNCGFYGIPVNSHDYFTVEAQLGGGDTAVDITTRSYFSIRLVGQ